MATKTKGFFKKLLSSVLSAACALSGTALMSTAVMTSSSITAEAATGDPSTFSWDNATVYFLLTDRFCNGDTSNDNAYGRMKTVAGDNRATFHGGDFAGITKKINEGYFTDLGVNAIWLTAPYEQLNGYILGDNFAHYSYHGYYVTDYTETDDAYGTKEEFRTLVDTAHEHGIRIVMDIVMNHAGYNNMIDMYEYNYGTLLDGWKSTYDSGDLANYHKKIDYQTSAADWGRWWGSDWVRSGLPGYNTSGSGPSEMIESLKGLPDFRTESTTQVGIPQFLQTKWQKEGTLSEKMAKYGSSNTVTGYISTWLAEWVETYGIDGFRCDTAKHVDKASWKQLKTACVAALKKWKQNNPTKKLDDLDFWMTGECWDWTLSSPSDPYFTEGGFDSMINFETQGGGKVAQGAVAGTYADYANRINSSDNFNGLSYLSSHDSVLARPSDMYALGSAFLLLPGAVQIYYGDETARPLVSGIPFDGDGGAGHSLRSDMPWDSLDTSLVKHWGIVGRFRNNHISVGAGANVALTASSGVAFGRTYDKNGISDKVAGVIYASNNTDVSVDVSALWADGTMLTNFYDDSTATVSGGKVTFNSGAHGTILICEPDGTKGTVTVKHINQDTGETIKTETLSGLVGDSYTATPLSTEGYTVAKTEGSKTGTFSETPATVTFYYTFDSNNYAYITVNFVDASTGAAIADSVTEAGKVGSSFTAVPVDVKDYEFDAAQSDSTTITVKKGTNTITLKYNYVEPTNAKVHYYNANGWSSVYMYAYTNDANETQLLGAWPGKPMTSEGNGWFVCEVPDVETCRVLFNANGGDNGPQEPAPKEPGYVVSGEVWMKNGQQQTASKVNVLYVTTDGKTLGSATLKGLSGETYTTEAKTFSGYTLSSTPANATGTYGTSTITVTYTYTADIPVPETLKNTSAISASTIKEGSSVKLTCSSTGGSGDKQYAVYYKKSGASSWTTVKAYSSVTSVTYTPSASGTYTVRVTVKDGEGTTANQDFTLTVEPDNTLHNTSKVSATSVNANDTVKVTCSSTGGSGTKQYAVYYKKSGASSWTTVRDMATGTSVNFIPTTAGTYTLRVRVKDGNGNAVNKDFTITVSSPLTNTSKLGSTSVAKGSGIKLTCSATGGTGTKTYAVYYKLSSQSTWTMAQDYEKTTSLTIYPKSTGTYTVKVIAKDGAGTKSTKSLTFTSVAPLTNSSKVSKTTISKGESIKITCASTGGTGTKQYAVYYKKSTQSSWMTVKNYSTATTATVTPKNTGTYYIRTIVKDGTGAEKYLSFTVKVNEALINNSKISATSIAKGGSIKVTCAATGGSGTKQYAVYYKKSTQSSWMTAKKYSTATTATVTPQNTGTYYIRTIVKDGAGTEKYLSFTVTVSEPLTNTSKVSATSITYGSSVKVTCSATGGSGTKQYAVYYKKSTQSSWMTAKSYSTTATATVTPKNTGTYYIRTIVKDGSGTEKYLSFTVTVKEAALTNTSDVSALAILKGKSFTVNCSATGGSGTKQYAVYYKKTSASSWTTAQAYSTNTKVTITPNTATTYDVCIRVKDGNDTVSKMFKTVAVNSASSSLANNSTISATSVSAGTKITLKGASSNGNDMVMYKYEYKSEDASSYTTIKDYSTTTSATFTPSKAGRYFVRVLVLDMTPNTKVKCFVVTVK